jgi:hypothetical protein
MPQGIVPNPSFYFNHHRSVVPKPEGSGRLRFGTWLRRRALDDQIARGVQTGGDKRLALRAEQLVSHDERSRLARALEHTLDVTGRGAEARGVRRDPVWSVRVPLRVREIRDCADDFEALVARLRDEEPIDAQGVAMTRRLLGDGGSPLYYRRSPITLRHAVRSARLALEPVSAPAEVEVPLAA